MNLKFIGTDGSMGLKHGEVYEVSVHCTFKDEVIRVKWYKHPNSIECPYSSPAAFAANWAKPGQPQKVVVRKKTVSDDSAVYSKYKQAIKQMKKIKLRDLLRADIERFLSSLRSENGWR